MPELYPALTTDALDQCREMIRVGSKSFSLAATLFDPRVRDGAFFLYGWCRFCDDEVDEAGSAERARAALLRIRKSTTAAFSDAIPQQAEFIALQHVTRQYQIPSTYALELLEGMRMDVEGQRYETIDELRLYCYRVAGTVGLMMTHIMGVTDERALRHAVDLGIAMQLTNIARDVRDDAARGRVYLPLSWLREAGIPVVGLGNPEYAEQTAKVARRLVETAQPLYESGEQGLRYLSFRSALAVAVAGKVYRSIGERVIWRDACAWDTRTVVPRFGKLAAFFRGTWRALMTLPTRLTHPRRESIAIKTLWRHS